MSWCANRCTYRLCDPVVQRRDGTVSYNVAVVADDIRDGVTEVVRGADLLDYTGVQMHLYSLFAGPSPTWMHSPLLMGSDNRKLSKSHNSLHVAQLRDAGWEPHHLCRWVLPMLGLPAEMGLSDAIDEFKPDKIPTGPLYIFHETEPPSVRSGIRWHTSPTAS